MPIAEIDGIETQYEVVGQGHPILMFSPGGFDATIERWGDLGIYARTKPLENLSKEFACVVFDRRECGRSGGRVETVSWELLALQGKGLLDHLGIRETLVMGACMGVSVALKFATMFPSATRASVLYWPAGGAHYRIKSQCRFSEHLGFIARNSLKAVVDLVRSHDKSFGADPRGGPWTSLIRRSEAFAIHFACLDIERYKLVVLAMARDLFDRDTVPGLTAEELLLCQTPALIISGNDASHAASAARYLSECLNTSVLWDRPARDQNEENTRDQLGNFLAEYR